MSRPAGLLAAALVLLLTGCQGGSAEPEPDAEPPGTTDSATGSDATEAPPGPADRLGLAEGWGPTESELDAAVRRARHLSLPELAGQLIVADWSGTAAPVRMIRRLHLGGVIAFSDNISSPGQIAEVNRTLRRQVRRPWPLFLGVDQEGGIVERIPTTPFPTFMSAGAAHDVALTGRAYERYGAELAGLGFTVDFAPDADVTTGPADPTIGSRSAGSVPDAVADQVTAAARGLQAGGVVPVLKHFPGHGSVPADSHLTLPVQTRSLNRMRRSDLVPFAAAVEAGLPAVMVGHIDVRAVDRGVPSSLSHRVVTGLLRHDLGFQGLVVTDSLRMAAVTKGRSPGAVAVRAVRAGADVLLMPPDPAAARAALVRSVRSGDLAKDRLLRAAARQIALLTHDQADPAAAGANERAASAASRDLSAAAVTVVAGPCSGRLVEDTVVPTGDPAAAAAFARAARSSGLTVLEPRVPPARLTKERSRPERRDGEARGHFRERRHTWRHRERRRRHALDDWRAAEAERLSAGTSVAFTGYGDGPVSGDVAVATDTPYPLGGSDAPVRIATYGETPGAMAALVRVLRGDARAPGRLPVDVEGVERRGCGR